MKIKLLFIYLFLTSASLQASFALLDQWISKQKTFSTFRLRSAISPFDGSPGSVYASPSKVFPNYYYHWVRDAAIVLKEILELKNTDTEVFHQIFRNFIDFSRKNQLTVNFSGGPDDLGLGEPKFNIDGSIYAAPWGRPQNDGPAIRAFLIAQYAKHLLLHDDLYYVLSKIYRPELPAKTLLKADLEYTAHHWRDPSFDLWEEFKGDHFYTRMVQWQALKSGAEIAEALFDDPAALFYKQQAEFIKESLENFWSPESGIIKPTSRHDDEMHYKHSDLDISVLLAVIQVGDKKGPFSITDERVFKTALALEKKFNEIYPVNKISKNHVGEKISAAIGRYPEDRYNGYNSNGEGNPWFLSTLALAEYYFLLANEYLMDQDLYLRKVNHELATALFEKADSFLRRVQFHTNSKGNLSEQFNKNHGLLQGARDLTWSYAAFLSCIRAREQVISSYQFHLR